MWVLLACVEKEPDTGQEVRDSDPPDSDGWVDADGDGYSPEADELVDCDDGDPAVNPGADEVCNALDDDCDGEVDEAGWVTLYRDFDRDGYGDVDYPDEGCPGDGWVTDATDCHDAHAEINPGAKEICDGWDDDCDGVVPEDELDGDGDGIAACDGDCDDGDSAILPGVAEACDGVDTDCDGVVPADEADGDGDGEETCAGDCDDADASAWSGAVERCEGGIDEDCDGEIDTDCIACTVILTTADSVQDAIDAAADGDVICLEGGTWYESIDYGGAEVSVVGVGAATILDGSGAGRVVAFTSGEGSGAKRASVVTRVRGRSSPQSRWRARAR
jgi:hypothetical protein